MNNCDYCGEYKKVKKEWDIFSGEHNAKYPSIFPFNYICEDCDKALKIKEKESINEEIKNKIKKQQDWIKERDKILNSSIKRTSHKVKRRSKNNDKLLRRSQKT